MVASQVPLSGDLAYTPGICALDWESNQQPFGSQASTQSPEPHQPEPIDFFNWEIFLCKFIYVLPDYRTHVCLYFVDKAQRK